VQEQAHEDANIIFGASIDETLGENVKVTVIATGFDTQERDAALEAPAGRAAFAQQSIPSPQSRLVASGSGMRPTGDSAHAASVRRPMHGPSPFAREHERHDPRAQAGGASQQRPAVRERDASRATQDAFPGLDHDWDIPAFQRKQR
jgi:cell division protein FtsZ